MSEKIPCKCFHQEEDHRDLGTHKQSFSTWCIFSEYNQCACDYFVIMTNLEYLDWKYERQLDIKSNDKSIKNI